MLKIATVIGIASAKNFIVEDKTVQTLVVMDSWALIETHS